VCAVSETPRYEYAEVVVGLVGRGPGRPLLPFMQVSDVTGRSMTPDFVQGPLEALNLMGAQGWKLLSQREATSDHMNWVAGELKTHDDTVEFNDYHQATVYLMVRQVRD
jgi:hypothetical protein